jgi:hypothetical protein
LGDLSESLLIKLFVVFEFVFEFLDGFMDKVVQTRVVDEEGIFDVFHEDFIVVLGSVAIFLILIVRSRVKLSGTVN